MLITACGGEPPPPPQDKPVPPDAREIVDPPPADVGELPKECGIYKALVVRLASCESLGPQRGLLEKQFDTSWKAWTGLPKTEHGNIAAGCRAAADAVRAAAAGPCAW